MDEFLSRVDLAQPLPAVLNQIVQVYQLGTTSSYSIIRTGYQELNLKLVTSLGSFIVKIFSKEKSFTRIKDNITNYLEFARLGIPVPQLRKNQSGYLYQVSGKLQPNFLCVMNYFSGKSFLKLSITNKDLHALTHFIARIHKINRKIGHYYDTLGIVNFLTELKPRQSKLMKSDLDLILPVVTDFTKLDWRPFSRSLIHGTLERENIFKNASGEYCILDLGCTDYNASILDLATFIANFTITMSIAETQSAYHLILAEYQKYRQLNLSEIQALPVLIKAQYATLVSNVENKTSSQSRHWINFGRKGLLKMQQYKV